MQACNLWPKRHAQKIRTVRFNPWTRVALFYRELPSRIGISPIHLISINKSGMDLEESHTVEIPPQLPPRNRSHWSLQSSSTLSPACQPIVTGKKYKVNLISSVANWTGYLVPQSFGQELGTNGLISITASDGLHLLQGIDYVADKNRR